MAEVAKVDMRYDPGTKAWFRGRECAIVRAVDLSHVLIRRCEDGEFETAAVDDLRPAPPGGKGGKARAIETLSEAEWNEAARRLAIIKPMMDAASFERGPMARAAADEHGVSVSTLYRWIRSYRGRRLLTDLAPRRAKVRKTRMTKRLEAIVRQAIAEVRLTPRRGTKKRVYEKVRMMCRAAHLKPPSEKTIRRRIGLVQAREATRLQAGEQAAHYGYDEVKGTYPGADHPLAVVQVDHTRLDVTLVDDLSRRPLGNPVLSLAMDVYSRMVTGFYLSLDDPSAFSVGMCLCHSILPKEPELDRMGIEGEWPVWGLMGTMHADNGRDFRSEAIRKSCEQYGINIEWRPLGKPGFGGHVERLLGTFAKAVHSLPGTTFSNVREKGIYDSEAEAAMTLDEVTRWLTDYIVNVYHREVHRHIGMPPIERWRRGVLGHGRSTGIGHRPRIADPQRLRIDFLPMTERTVQREGITWDNVWYFAPCLRPWINARRGRQKMKFTVRRDPRDVSRIWLLDPKTGDYLAIPYRTISRPGLNLWELRAAMAEARKEGRDAVDEEAIFRARERMERLTEGAVKETRKTRRATQRKRHHAKIMAEEKAPETPEDTARKMPEDTAPAPAIGIEDEDDVFDFSEEDVEPRWEEWK